uniref:Uncharacterized protein n=2 Tax=Anguilla anguilla TaxID=7936 RepID=A0A0E9VKG5_ANGAN
MSFIFCNLEPLLYRLKTLIMAIKQMQVTDERLTYVMLSPLPASINYRPYVLFPLPYLA